MTEMTSPALRHLPVLPLLIFTLLLWQQRTGSKVGRGEEEEETVTEGGRKTEIERERKRLVKM